MMSLRERCPEWSITSRRLWSFVLPFLLLSLLTDTGAWGAQLFTISLDDAPIWYIYGEGPLPPVSGHYLMERTGTTSTTNDACNPLTPGSLTGRVALIRRGICTFSQKINNASAAGAVGVVIYNNTDGGLMTMSTPGTSIPAVFITKADGEMIDTRLQAGPVIMTWTDTVTPVISSVTSTTANGTYGVGSAVDVTLNFNEPVTVAPDTLAVTLNTGAVLKPSALQSATSVSTTYTVQANESATDLTVTSIAGRITNAAGIPTFNPTIPAGQNLGDAKDIAISYLLLPKVVTPSITGKGTILPATPQSIAHGSVTTFTVTPDTGYTASVGGSCGGTLAGAIYTTSAITADCTVIASFQKFPWPMFLPAITKGVQ